jgi:hypothetical protein
MRYRDLLSIPKSATSAESGKPLANSSGEDVQSKIQPSDGISKPDGLDQMKRKGPGKWTSDVLTFCLCNPEGEPVFVGSSFLKCLGQYVSNEMQDGAIILNDADAVAYARMLERSSWTIRRCEIVCVPGNQVKSIPKRETVK